MKRVIQRKAEHSICGEPSKGGSNSKQKRASQDIGNKTRTSAAMLGLALSMGASGSILSQGKHAVAAEPEGKIDVSSVEGLLDGKASQDLEPQNANHVLDDDGSKLSHVIREGETLWTISSRYNVSSDSLIEANGFDNDIVLRVGQKVAIPSVGPEPVKSVSSDTVESPVVGDVDVQSLVAVVPTEADSENLAQLQLDDLSSDNGSSNVVDSQSDQVSADGSSVTGSAKVVESKPVAEPQKLAPRSSESVVDEASVGAPTATIAVVEVESGGAPQSITALENVDEPVLIAEHVAFSEVQSSSSSSVLDDSVVLPTTHQIRVGETLTDIARRYNISTQELAEANRIRNPNRIFAGRVLNLPDGAVASVEPVVSEVVATIPLGPNVVAEESVDGERVASLPSVPEFDSSRSFGELIAPDVPSLEPQEQIDSSFYINRLLGEIEQLTQSYVSSGDLSDEVVDVSPSDDLSDEVVDVSPSESEVVAYVPSANADTLPVRVSPRSEIPTFQPEQAEVSVPTQPLVPGPSASQGELISDDAELVASAPLGAENYVPLNQPVTGRMVSPDLPPLSGPENYLPDSSESFNGYTYPAQGTLTSGYGWRWGRMHRGIDVAAPVGTPIVAAAPGVIEYSGWNSGGYGNMVEVRHPDGSMTRYAHNSRNLLRVGQQVAQGEQIAEMGSTGYSTGPHVHFEIHLPSQGTVNPVAYLNP